MLVSLANNPCPHDQSGLIIQGILQYGLSTKGLISIACLQSSEINYWKRSGDYLVSSDSSSGNSFLSFVVLHTPDQWSFSMLLNPGSMR
jgi:hypothetical protein